VHEVKKRFSDFAKDHQPLEGSKCRINDVLNREILVLNYRLSASKYSQAPCLTLQFMIDDEKHVLFTGSAVLIEQIEMYKNELPFYATIKKIDRYFTFI